MVVAIATYPNLSSMIFSIITISACSRILLLVSVVVLLIIIVLTSWLKGRLINRAFNRGFKVIVRD